MPGFMSGVSVVDGTITEAKLADNAVTLAKMAGGTDGNLIGIDASGDPAYIATGSDGQILTSGGAGVAALMEDAAGGGGFTLGTEQATVSTTAITFSGIPSGTTMIVIMFEGVSTTFAPDLDIEIGDAGGIEVSGYIARSSGFKLSAAILGVDSTTGYIIFNNSAGDVFTGNMYLTLKDASNNTWTQTHWMRAQSDQIAGGSGVKSLSAELTQLRIDGATFDAGSINIMYQ
jgi:hypothetical protein